MITRLSIENFKAIGDEQSIELAPITLLFGGNSVGKSSILQALQYLRSIVVESDPSGDGEVLGGFTNAVRDRDQGSGIIIGVEMQPSSSDSLAAFSFGQRNALDEGLAERISNVSLRTHTVWDYSAGLPFVCEWAVAERDDPRFLLHSAAANLEPIFTANLSSCPWFSARVPNLVPELREAVDEPRYWYPAGRPQAPFPAGATGYRVVGQRSAIPGAEFQLDLMDESMLYDFSTEHAHLSALAEITAAVHGTRKLAAQYLDNIRHIGPIRTLPSRVAQASGTAHHLNWYDGSAAWEILRTQHGLAEGHVAPWLDLLETGYYVSTQARSHISGPEKIAVLLQQFLANQSNVEPVRAALKLLADSPKVTDYQLLELESRLTVHPRDIGVGISQLLPVVVAALSPNDAAGEMGPRLSGLVAIEQPELHVHPRIQANLGDLFGITVRDVDGELNGRQYLIETHSEHLVLRLLRRVRETTERGIDGTRPSLRPDDIAIYYVERVDRQAVLHRIHIDEDGEFIDKWPQGFFTERLREL
jgi:predicted ATPase